MTRNLSRRTFLVTTSLMATSASFVWPKESILVGCQTNGIPLPQGDFPAFLKGLELLKSLGYTGFECNFRFLECVFDRTAGAREEIAKTGMKFIGAHASLDQIQGAKGAAIAAGVSALGADCIVMSSRGLSPQGKFEKDALIKKARAIEAVARMLAVNRLRLAYHNHNPEFANNNAEITGLAENTDPKLVSFLMDAGHGRLGGGDPAAFLTAHTARVYGIHLKTFKGNAEKAVQVPLGQGDFDFQDLAAAVKKTGWSGWIIVEEGGGPRAGDPATLRPDREHIRKLFGV